MRGATECPCYGVKADRPMVDPNKLYVRFRLESKLLVLVVSVV